MDIDGHAIDALVLAAVGTGSLLLVSRGFSHFDLSLEKRAWMGFAWLLIFVAAVLICQAVRA